MTRKHRLLGSQIGARWPHPFVDRHPTSGLVGPRRDPANHRRCRDGLGRQWFGATVGWSKLTVGGSSKPPRLVS
nr:hypothetical protein Iba_chr07aCG14750 [Ipomoea batatas]